jgi:hypothetical protein
MAIRFGWDDEVDESGDWIPRTPQVSLPIPDELVEWAIRSVMLMDVIGDLTAWKSMERKGLGGRPQVLPLHAVLVAMTTACYIGEPMLATAFCDILFVRISPGMRKKLNVPDPPGQFDIKGWNACYKNVRTRLHVDLFDLVDPSDTPKGRRLSHAEYERIYAARKARRTDADRLVCDDRLTWICNRIIEASLQQLPREFRRRWKKGSVALDATPVKSFARMPRQVAGTVWGNRLEQKCHSADPDAGFYQRTRTISGDTGEALGPTKSTVKKSDWAFDLALVVAVPDNPDDELRIPPLVIGMTRLDVPGVEPGQNGIRALQDISSRGYPAGDLLCDRAYSSAKPEKFQLPARSLGYHPNFDYRIDQLGIKASAAGFNQVEGGWYCPSMPDELTYATLDLRERRISEEMYDARIEERRLYEARPKGRPDPEGFQRYMCPASDGCLVARCENKPGSMRSPKPVGVRITLKPDVRANPPKACRQQSVMIGPEAGAKFAQDLHYGSPEWKALYGMRNLVEGVNGYVKDGAHEALADPMRRRILGVAAQSVFCAFLLFATNIRMIEAFEKVEAAIEAGAATRLVRRRVGRSLQDFRPGSRVGTNPAQPEPD